MELVKFWRRFDIDGDDGDGAAAAGADDDEAAGAAHVAAAGCEEDTPVPDADFGDKALKN